MWIQFGLYKMQYKGVAETKLWMPQYSKYESNWARKYSYNSILYFDR
jgi:hypothetical protein